VATPPQTVLGALLSGYGCPHGSLSQHTALHNCFSYGILTDDSVQGLEWYPGGQLYSLKTTSFPALPLPEVLGLSQIIFDQVGWVMVVFTCYAMCTGSC